MICKKMVNWVDKATSASAAAADVDDDDHNDDDDIIDNDDNNDDDDDDVGGSNSRLDAADLNGPFFHLMVRAKTYWPVSPLSRKMFYLP